MFTIGESRARHWTTSITSGWKSSIFNRNSSGERRLKFIASREDDDNKKPRAKHREKRLAQRRQRRQHSDHKQVQKQRQNTTITRQMEPMKRGNTDCRRFKRRWGDQATLTVYIKIIFFDVAIGSNSYTICTSRTGADLGGGCRGYAPPLSPWDDLRFSNTTDILPKKKTMWFIGVEVEQETSTPPPKKNPGSAPEEYLSNGLKTAHISAFTPWATLGFTRNP